MDSQQVNMDSQQVNMKGSIKVEIVSTRLIKPSLPTPPHRQLYNLSVFDQMSYREHVPLVLLYPHCNNEVSSINDVAEMDKRLELSLSKVLTHVVPAAGRYGEDECSILCLDQGVPFTKAKVNCKLENFLEETRKKGQHLVALFWPHGTKDVDEATCMTTPILVAQITMFECGGMAVAISASHPAMDGFTTMLFVFEWANVCRLGTPVENINFLSFDSSAIFPPRDLSKYFKSHSTLDECREPNIVAKRFVIHAAAILRLKQKLAGSGASISRTSKVEMIVALLWRALIRVSEARNGYLRPFLMCFPVNLRSKIPFSKMDNSMGNFIFYAPVKFIPGKTALELHHLIMLIRDEVKKIVASCAKASPDEIVSTLANIYNESYRSPQWGGNDEIDKLTCSSLCRFPMQDADFGRGKPSLLFFGENDMQMFWLHDTDCRTGVDLQVDLKESYMELFECDQDIKSFTTVY